MSDRSPISVSSSPYSFEDLVLLEAGEAVQPHLQDGLGLRFAQPVHVAMQPEFGGERHRAAS